MKRGALVATLFALALSACPPDDTLEQVQKELELSDRDLRVKAPEPALDAEAERARFLDECGGEDVPSTPPTAPARPVIDEIAEPLPEQCNKQARIEGVLASCGGARSVAFESLAQVASECGFGSTCIVNVPAGTHAGQASLACVILEGAGDDTVVQGWLAFSGPSVVSRMRIEDGYGAASTTADVLFDEVTLSGGYEALGIAWDQEIDVAVCRSRVAGGYSGVALSWGSDGIVVAGSGIAACYEGLALSWGSSGMHATRNVVYGKYSAVHIHQSSNVAVLGNVLFSSELAVAVSQPGPPIPELPDDYNSDAANILVSRNRVIGGSLPESDAALGIVVENNE